jgi:hypothetical protein
MTKAATDEFVVQRKKELEAKAPYLRTVGDSWMEDLIARIEADAAERKQAISDAVIEQTELAGELIKKAEARISELEAALSIHYPDGLPTIGDCKYDREGTGAAGYAAQGCPENRADSDSQWWCTPCRVRTALAGKGE